MRQNALAPYCWKQTLGQFLVVFNFDGCLYCLRFCTLLLGRHFTACLCLFYSLQVFVLKRQLLIFSSGGSLPDQPPLYSSISSPASGVGTAGLDVLPPKLGSEINLGWIHDRISFIYCMFNWLAEVFRRWMHIILFSVWMSLANSFFGFDMRR